MLRESEFFQNHKIRILLCVELVFLLIGVIGLLGTHSEVMGREDTDLLLGEGIPLPAGVYTLKVSYEVEDGNGNLGSFGVVVEPGAPYRTLLSNPVPFYSGLSEGNCQFFLLGHTERLKLVLNGAEGVRILSAKLLAGNEGSRVYLFWVIVFCLVLDMILILAMYHRWHPIPRDRQLIYFGIPLITLIVSLPVLVDYSFYGDEFTYQLLRIEALVERIAQGEMASRMGSLWLAGHGYGDSLFRGETLLFVPALLRILGFPVGSAYGIFVMLVNLATVWIAYICFFRCFHNRFVAFFGSALYTLAPYRVYTVYDRAAVGEFTSMIFLPLVVWGWYRIYMERKESGWFKSGLPLVIGFSGLLQCDVTVSAMAVGVMVALGLVFVKKTFQRHTLGVFFCSVGMTILLNAWFLVPALDLAWADRYNFYDIPMEAVGYDVPSMVFDGVGTAILLCLILWLVISNRNGSRLTEEQKKGRAAGNAGVIFTVLLLFMSTRYFPWTAICSLGRVPEFLMGFLESPVRFTVLAIILSVFSACVFCQWVLQNGNLFPQGKIILLLILLGVVVFGNYQLNEILLTHAGPLRLYTAQSLNTSAVLQGAYLPEGTEIDHMTYHEPMVSEGTVLEAYEKKDLTVYADVAATREAYVDFPMLYYKGYQAQVQGTRESLSVEKGDNGDVRVLFPKEFQGTVRIWYAGMWYWRVAEGLSLTVGVGLIIWWFVGNHRRHITNKFSRTAKKEREETPLSV